MAYDAVIIGAGHNGLAAGVHLAARGKRVAIVEAKEEPGGAVKTRDLTLPGFRHDLCAMNLSMFAGSGFFAAHKDALVAHGLAFVPAEHAFATVFRDGTYLGVSRTLETTLAGISALSPADAKGLAGSARTVRRGCAPHLRAPRFAHALGRGREGRVEGVAGHGNEPALRHLEAAAGVPARLSRCAIRASESQDDDGRLGPASRFPAGRRGGRALPLSRIHGQPEPRHGDRRGRRGHDRQGDGRGPEGEGRRAHSRRRRIKDRPRQRRRVGRDIAKRPQARSRNDHRQRSSEDRIRAS